MMMSAEDPTRSRLLEAAGLEFAERGFAGARVRAICDRAGANLAAVNYHFGDKVRLYGEAVLEAHRCGSGGPYEAIGDLPPEQALRAFIGHFLANVAALRASGWHQALMLREMLAPTAAAEALVGQAIRPRFDLLCSILRRICPGADDRRVHALAFSVVGQCLHYKVSAAMSERIVGAEAFGRLDPDYLADHIAGFTLAALGVVPPLGRSAEPSKSPRGPARSGKGGKR